MDRSYPTIKLGLLTATSKTNILDALYGSASPTCPVKCELLIILSLFNRDDIFVALISSGHKKSFQFQPKMSKYMAALVNGVLALNLSTDGKNRLRLQRSIRNGIFL